ncbi:Sec8 exocyst complex component-specific domain-containing protein [Thamnocephalis sphaerospora]|uniref:Exocyst complex component Sec8 n=1 Tax=Thamnocephalis sphaerospora TaxID=78915 RepID=A0A4P9XN79_9FUNG|nr:Sec8 exocyst complex component-specific domain-containing protein [Thamnocephalis sphaerospora]|eukprot:RKP07365.1 Sec8 exocyst complex component-specific domain-containing protein [Thamnocephalis sphaerospora]
MSYEQARGARANGRGYGSSEADGGQASTQSAPRHNPYRRRAGADGSASTQGSRSGRDFRSDRSGETGGGADAGAKVNPYARKNPYARAAPSEATSPQQTQSPQSNGTEDHNESMEGQPGPPPNQPSHQHQDSQSSHAGEREERGGRKQNNRVSVYGGRYANAAGGGGGGSSHTRTKSTVSQRSLRSNRTGSMSRNRWRQGEDTAEEAAYQQLQQLQQQQQQQPEPPQYPDGVFDEIPVLEDVLRKFPELEDDNFNAVELAMALIDKNKRRVDPSMFQQLSDRLEHVVDRVVRTHHRSFTDTIDAYSGVLEAVTSAQKVAAELKTDMIECKDSLRLKRGDLGQWWTRSQQHREMIRLLDDIEALKKVPERVEQLRRKQQHSEAVSSVVDALERVEKGPLAEVGALAELRKQLQAERHTMHERLIEELLQLLYLKSTQALHQDVDALEGVDQFISWQGNNGNHGGSGNGQEHGSATAASLSTLLQCLYRLGKLPEAFEAYNTAAWLEQDGGDAVQLMRLLQSKLLVVIEMHRQVYIRVAEIDMDSQSAALVTEFGLSAYKEAWLAVQNELKSILYDYLSEDQRGADPLATPAASINEALRTKRKHRDNRKKLFRLLDSDAVVDFADAYEAVQHRIDCTFPDVPPDGDDAGNAALGSGTDVTSGDRQRHAAKTTMVMAKALLGSGEATERHRLLAKPGAVVTSKLFRPMLEFLERARRLDRCVT